MSLKEYLAFGFIPISKKTYGDLYINVNDAILLVRFKKDLEIDIEIANKIIEDSYTILSDNKLQYIISDNREPFITSTEEARELMSDNRSLRLVKANAVLVEELSVRLLVNSFVKVNKPAVPFKSCESFKEAIGWLKGISS